MKRRIPKADYVRRAARAKQMLYRIFGFGALKIAAEKLNKSPAYVAGILGGHMVSRPCLLEIEKLIVDECERAGIDRYQYSNIDNDLSQSGG